MTNQTFRDLYYTDTLDPDQRLKITSLTFLFTDLKGSTALYERAWAIWSLTISCASTSAYCTKLWLPKQVRLSRQSEMP